MTTTAHVVLEAQRGGTVHVVGVYTDPALAARVAARAFGRVILAGPTDREWGRPR